MKISKEEFEKCLEKFNEKSKSIFNLAASKAEKICYDFNTGDKSITLTAITQTESLEITTREGLDYISATAFTSTTSENINRNIMKDKPQIFARIFENEIKIEPFEGADEEIVKRLTEKVNELNSKKEEEE